MNTDDWEEVKRLAADFQKAQLNTSFQKLSERNCIEIVTKLIESNQLNVIFTIDGKEYVTPQHLEKEIKDELYVHDGRIDLIELTKLLNVDFTQVQKAATELEKHDKGVKKILGQLIDKNYMVKLIQEINDKLNQTGFINLADLMLSYNLPADFFQSLIEKSLGKTIHARQDEDDLKFFYTESFLMRNKAKVRGALSAITKPLPLSAILGQCNIPEKIFSLIIDKLSGSMQLPGTISGRQSSSGMYIPAIYSKSQFEWIENFYKQNGYLEYDVLNRLGISDPKGYIKRHWMKNNLIMLGTAAVGPMIIDQIDANIEEIIATNSFIDIFPMLPSIFTLDDIEILLQDALKRSKNKFHIFATTFIVSDVFLQNLNKQLEPLVEEKAKIAYESGKWLQHVINSKLKSSVTTKNIENNFTASKKDERRKKTGGGKSGGGAQGRETKIRSTKKKYNQSSKDNYDDDSNSAMSVKNEDTELILVSVDDLRGELTKYGNLNDVEELSDELVNYLQPKLNKMAHQIAEQLSQTNKITNMTEIEEKLNTLVSNIKMFDKGIKCFHNKETVSTLTKYLIKTLGTDFLNEILTLAAQQNVIQCPSNFTNETRQKIIDELPDDVQEPLNNLQKAVVKGSSEDFLNFVDGAMSSCSLILRKFDKKKEKSMVLNHRQALIEQLKETQDPALALHLVTSVLFTTATQAALHTSGRHIITVLPFLKDYFNPDVNATLMEFHDWVLKMLSSKEESSKIEVMKLLEDGMQRLKDIAYNSKEHLNNKSDKNCE